MNQRSFSAPRNGLLPHDISGNEATSTSQAPHVKTQLLQEELHCSALHDLHSAPRVSFQRHFSTSHLRRGLSCLRSRLNHQTSVPDVSLEFLCLQAAGKPYRSRLKPCFPGVDCPLNPLNLRCY